MKKYHVTVEFDWDATVTVFIAICVGMFIGVLVALGVHNNAIERELHRKYLIKNPTSAISFEEWKALKDS